LLGVPVLPLAVLPLSVLPVLFPVPVPFAIRPA
jgi:hypothetical protein